MARRRLFDDAVGVGDDVYGDPRGEIAEGEDPMPPPVYGEPTGPTSGGGDLPARSSEDPRDRDTTQGGTSPGPGGGGTGATPPRPSSPSPVAGQPPVAPPTGPFPPIGQLPGDPSSPDPTLGTTPFSPTSKRRGLLGSSGGLTGGGLGVPFDPMADESSPDISGLLELLLGGGRGLL